MSCLRLGVSTTSIFATASSALLIVLVVSFSAQRTDSVPLTTQTLTPFVALIFHVIRHRCFLSPFKIDYNSNSE